MLRHKKHASAFIAFLMAFALIFTSSRIGSLTFTKADDTQTIYYNGESVTLSEHALYVNQNSGKTCTKRADVDRKYIHPSRDNSLDTY